MKKTFVLFDLVKELKMSPDEIAKLLSKTIFKNMKTEFYKGFLNVEIEANSEIENKNWEGYEKDKL